MNNKLNIKTACRTAYRSDGVAFKVVGVVTLFILSLVVCDLANGGEVAENPPAEVNTWNAIHELRHNDYGVANVERDRLVEELELVLALVGYTTGRIDNFDIENGLDNLNARINALFELIKKTDHAFKSITREITWFVKNHTRGI